MKEYTKYFHDSFIDCHEYPSGISHCHFGHNKLVKDEKDVHENSTLGSSPFCKIDIVKMCRPKI
jgi:hypothetical protein